MVKSSAFEAEVTVGSKPTSRATNMTIMKLTRKEPKRLLEVLKTPQTELQKQTIRRAAGLYEYYKSKWK